MANFIKIVRKFPRTFWIANSMELLERWAYYGIFMVLALYLTGSTDEGALGFTNVQKGQLMGIFGMLVYLLPLITGAIADRIGFKMMLFLSYIILASGYYMISLVHSYPAVFMVFMYIAVGAAMFKPVVSATIAKTTDEETSSIGFGIFYMVVNIGSFIGPIAAGISRKLDWKYVFIISSAVILLNMLILLFYKESDRVKDKTPFGESIKKIFKNIAIVLKDVKFDLFLLIIIGFWTMYLQLFFSLGNFIDQWVDTARLYDIVHSFSPHLADKFSATPGRLNPELISNMDALFIIIFQVMVSTMVMRFKPLSTMIVGILINAIGLGLWFVSQNPLFIIVALLIFAFGEMTSSPKITEYIGRIAPKDKVGLYMGMSYLPLAGGYYLAGILSGSFFENHADKFHFLRLELAAKGFSVPEISKNFTLNDFWAKGQNLLGLSDVDLTNFLWQTYHPYNIWMVFTGIGVFTVIALFLYDRFILNPKGK